MDKQSIGEKLEQQRVTILLVIVGILLGVLIAIGVMLLIRPTAQLAEGDAAVNQVAEAEVAVAQKVEVQQRWYIWEGNAPLLGEPFETQELCEQSRQDFVETAIATADREAKSMEGLSFRQVQALGYNPMDRVMEGLAKIRRAYCRKSS